MFEGTSSHDLTMTTTNNVAMSSRRIKDRSNPNTGISTQSVEGLNTESDFTIIQVSYLHYCPVLLIDVSSSVHIGNFINSPRYRNIGAKQLLKQLKCIVGQSSRLCYN